MQLVIEIDERIYNNCKEECEENPAFIVDGYTFAIGNGIVLPKGHGRLIDADDIDNHIIGHVDTRSCPTIIEADTGEQNEEI